MAEGESPIGPDPGGPQPTGTGGGSDEGLIQTFLIADIRGYTLFTQDHGDEAAGRLAGRYAQVITEVIEAQGGAVIELTGDEALCVFSTTRRAIRAAIDLQTRFVAETTSDPALPLPVGIGIDTGEAVPVGGGFRGRALNMASRLCAVARAGEILTTREAIHMAGSMTGISVEDRGPSSFKNMPEPVSVMRVTGEGENTARWFAEHLPSPRVRPRISNGRRVALVGLATLLVAAISIPLLRSNGSASSFIEPDSMGVLDPGSGELSGTIGLEERPGSVAASAEAVWVTNPDSGTVTRIDPNEREVRDSIQVGSNPTGIAIGFDAVWVLNSGGPSVSRISPDTNSVVDTIGVGNGPAGVAVGEGYVWVTNRFDGTISRIDPDSGDVKTTPVGLDPRGIAVGFNSVWVALAGSNTVLRFNPQTDVVTPIVVGNGPGSIAVSADAVWAVNTLGNTVSRISPETNLVVDTIEVGHGPSGIAIVQGVVWVANEADGTISGIGPGQSPVRTIAVESVPQGLASVNGDLWVSVSGAATSHRGGTLRVVSTDGPLSLDPAVVYDIISLRVPHLLGDGLVGFESIGGTNASLVPDLATSVPTPTDGGRTYTFVLHPGIRYSNGDVVAPTDFLRGFERGFHLSNRSVYRYLYGGLVGADTCWQEPPTCDLSRGIVTDDASETITFHLEGADPDFLDKLTMAFSYPVPSSTPNEEQVTEGVPGTGPYMPDAPMTDEGLTLVRNPYFRVWSPAAQPDGYTDRIEWTFGQTTAAQIQAVAAGDADLSFDPSYLPSDELEPLFVHYASQVRSSAQALTAFVVLNTEEPPFDNVEVRRAMNLAVDRDRVVQIFGGEGAVLPTCQQLPPNFPGYEPYCPYTKAPDGSGAWSGADFKRAKALVRRSGTAGMHVTYIFAPHFFKGQGQVLGDYLVKLLGKLGYRVSVKAVPADTSYYPGAGFQMALDAWGLDYPSAANFISNRFMCNATFSTGFCDPKIDAMIDRATRMQAGDPAAAGALWADVDHAIVDEAPYLWLWDGVAVEFVSERVGN